MTPGLLQRVRIGLLAAALCSCGAPARADVTSVVPPAVSGDVTVRITGSGFAPSVAEHEVLFQPATGAPVPGVVTAVSAPDATGTLRRLTVRVPSGLPVGRAAITVRNLATDQVSQGGAVEIVAISTSIGSVVPGAAVELPVTLAGNATFNASATRVSAGAGVTVDRVDVVTPTRLRVSVTVASNAALGPRALGVITPAMTAVVPDAFVVALEPPPPPVNVAPTVGAGPDQAITLPLSTVSLTGSASDDGLPAGSTVSVSWSQVSGPAAAVIGTPASLATTVSGLVAGTYVFRLGASDGQLSASDEVTLTVASAPPPPPTNIAPVVGAGGDQVITLPVDTASLSGTATDDGLPGGSGLLFAWSQVSGPAAGAIASPASLATDVSGLVAGTYVFRLTVTDGELPAFDEVQVTVGSTPPPPPPPPPANAGPTIEAGGNRAITLPENAVALAAQVSDDGNPVGVGTSVRWSVRSGPQPAEFSSQASANTTVTFPASGTWVLRATVTDGELSAFDELTVTVNPGAPPPPPPNRAPTANPGGPYVTDAERPIAVNGAASSDPDDDPLTHAWTFGDGATGSGPSPVHAWAAEGSYTVALTVTDGRGGSDTRTTSVAVGPPLDRAPPSVSLRVPAEVLPGTTVQLFADAYDNVGVSGVTIAVGADAGTPLPAAPYQRAYQVSQSAVPGARIAVTATARDAAGNSGDATATMTIVAAPDATPPSVSLNVPPVAAPGASVVITAAAADNVRVASVSFLQGALVLATDGVIPYEARFTLPADAQIGSVIGFVARALDDAGNAAEDVKSLTVVAAPDTTAPSVSLAAPERARGGDEIELVAEVTDDRAVAEVAFTVDGVPVASVAAPPYRTRFTVPAGRAAGSILRSRARGVDTSGNAATAQADTRVVDLTVGAALVFGAVYDDGTGLPLAAVDVAIEGEDNSGAPFSASARTDVRGRYVAVVRSGVARLVFTRGGFTRVARRVDLTSGANRVIDARLTQQPASATNVPAAAGATVARAGASLLVEPGALAADAVLRLTPVSGQALAALLPPGWSPLAALDIAPSGLALATPATLELTGLQAHAGRTLVAGQWDAARGAWIAIGPVVVTPEGAVSFALDQTGQVALLRADEVPGAPPSPTAGAPLEGVAATSLAADTTAVVSPDPRIAVYDPDVRSRVSATLAAATVASSGVLLRARLAERYRFYSGRELAPDVIVQDIVFYQRAGAGPLAAAAEFVVSPSRTFEAASLEEGVITVEVRAAEPPGSSFVVAGADGVKVVAPTGEALTVPAGAIPTAVAAAVRRLEVTALGVELPEALEFVGAADVDLGGATLAQPATISVPRPDGLVDETGLLVLRVGEFGGASRLEFVAVARIAGSHVVSDTAIAGLATPLAGIREGGRYVVVRAQTAIGTITGVVSGSDGLPFAGAVVETSTLPVVAGSRAGGVYVIAAAAGPVTLTAQDPATQDRISVALTLGPGNIGRRDLRLAVDPLRVTSVTPLDGAVDVTPGAPVTLSFSRSIDPATSGAVRVETASGLAIAGSVTLSDDDRIATFRPSASWAEKAALVVRVDTSLRDRSGRMLPSAFTSQFTTLDTAAPPPPPAGSITASLPVNGVATVAGTQGSAGLRDTVRIVNLTKNTFYPVLVNPDGSFSVNVPVSVRDELTVSITGASGNETSVALPPFSTANADGSRSTFVGPEGGRVTGPNGIAVDVPDGAFPDGTVITVKSIGEAEFPMTLTAEQRPYLSFTAGLSIDFGGATPTTYLDVSVPASPTDTLSDRWVLVGALEVAGRTLLQATDTAKVIDGRIVTGSPPCPGVLSPAAYGFVKALAPLSVVFGDLLPSAADISGAISVGLSQSGLGGLLGNTALPWVGLVAGPALRQACLPVLTSRVSMAPNTQRAKIAADQFTPASRSIVARNLSANIEQRFPRNVVEYRFLVPGTVDDRYKVTVRTAAASQVVPFDVSPAQASGRVNVRVDMDRIGQAVTSVVVENLSRTPTGVTEFPQDDAAARVPIPGGIGDQFDVNVEDVAGAQRAAQFTVESPSGVQPLVVRALPGTIEPGAVVELTNLFTNATTTLSPEEVVVGGFSRDVPGRIGDAYRVRVSYPQQPGRVPDESYLPTARVVVRSAATGRVLRSYTVPAPPPDEPFLNLGKVSDDTQAPSLLSTPPRLTDFDPSSVLSFRFSESLARDRAIAGFVVTGPAGRISGEVRLSDRNQLITFVPDRPLELGQSYVVSLQGITDLAGNAFAPTTFQVKTSAPKAVTTKAASAGRGGVRDLVFVDLDGRRTVLTLRNDQVAFTGSLQVVNATNSATPETAGSVTAGNRRVAVLQGVTGLRLRADNECGGGATFTGALALSTFSYNGAASLQVTDLRNPAAPCRMGGRTVASPLGSPADGIVRGTGFVNGVAGLIAANGVFAYVAVGQVGLFQVDVGAASPTPPMRNRPLEPYVAGDYWDVLAAGTFLVALERSAQRVDLFDPSLALLQSVNLSGFGELLNAAFAEQFPVDADRNGVVDANELRTMLFVGTRRGVVPIDLTDVDAPRVEGLIPVANGAWEVLVDPPRRRLIVGSVPADAEFVALILDLSGPDPFRSGDRDGDGTDDRVIWRSPPGQYGVVSSNFRGFEFDPDRQLLYVGRDGRAEGEGGFDVWALANTCCDLSVDVKAAPAPPRSDDTKALLERERRALQKGLAAGLAAAASCGVPIRTLLPAPPSADSLALLEQGSGACLWKDDYVTACQRSYQPGLSDHDFEVLIPAAYFVSSANSPADCVAKKLNEAFTAEDGTSKPIDVDGVVVRFADITFFPVVREHFEEGKLRVDPPVSSGSDPTGDLGLGRQQLLLKWVLEGEYVDVPGYDVSGARLADVLEALALKGVPVVEGLEWAKLQQHNLVKSRALLRVAGSHLPDSSFNPVFRAQLKDGAKAAIRATLARMTVDAAAMAVVFAFDRTDYGQTACLVFDGPTKDRWLDASCGSFEHFIASMAGRTVQRGLTVFSEADVAQQVARFARVKAGEERITSPAEADAFLRGAWRFLERVENETREAYNAGLPTADFREQREKNLAAAIDKTAKAFANGQLHVVPRVRNAGFYDARDVQLAMFRGSGGPGTGTRVTAQRVTLAANEERYLERQNDVRAVPVGGVTPEDRNLIDIAPLDPAPRRAAFVLGDGGPGNPAVDMSAAAPPQWVAFTIDLPEHLVKEADRANNVGGFWFYVLDRSADSPPPLDEPVPLPIADPNGDVLRPDTECEATPALSVTQSAVISIRLPGVPLPTPLELSDFAAFGLGEPATFRLRVTNTGSSAVQDVKLCSSVSVEGDGCFAVGTLSPGHAQTQEFTRTFDTAMVVSATAVAWGASAGVSSSPPLRLEIGCDPVVVVPPSPDPNPAGSDPAADVMRGGDLIRHYLVIDRLTGQPKPNVPVEIRFEVTGRGAESRTFISGADGFLTTGGERGVFFPVDPAIEPPSRITATITDVGGKPAFCNADTALFTANVVDRTYTRSWTAGSSISAKGAFEIGVAGKAGYGFSFTLNEVSGKQASTLTFGRSVALELGLVETVLKTGAFGSLFGATAEIGVKADAGAAFQYSEGDGYEFTLNNGLGSLAASEREIVGRLLLTTLLTNNLPILRDVVDERLVPPEAAQFRSSSVGSMGIEVSGSGKAGGTVGMRFLSDTAQQPGQVPFGVEAGGGLSAKVAGAFSLNLALKKKEMTPAFEVKGAVELSGAAGSGSGETSLKQGQLKLGLLEKFKTGLKGSVSETVKTAVTVDPFTLAPQKLAVSLTNAKGYGFTVGGQSGSPSEWKSVDGGGGRGEKSSISVTVADLKSMKDLFVGLRSAYAIALAFVKLPEPLGQYLGAQLDLVLGPRNVEEDVTRLIAALVQADAEYAISRDIGDALSLPTGFGVAILGIDFEIGKTLAVDRAISFTEEKGLVRQGRVYPLVRYRKDALIPNLPDSGDDFATFGKLALGAVLNRPVGRFDAVTGPPTAPGPNSVKSNRTAQMQWQGEGEPPFTPGILSWTYEIDPDAVGFRQPWQSRGRADAPHYGIGGFHAFAPQGHVFVRPATLTFFYRDDEVQGLDERTLAIYRWNDRRDDWDHIGGVVDQAANTVTAQVDRMAIYTLGPSMPAATIGLTVVSSEAGGTDQAPQTTVTYRSTTPLVKNTGAPVEAGTLYTVLATGVGNDATPFGTVLTADADSSTPGVQVAASGGVIEFTIRYDAGNTYARVFAHSREGTALGLPVLPLRP